MLESLASLNVDANRALSWNFVSATRGRLFLILVGHLGDPQKNIIGFGEASMAFENVLRKLGLQVGGVGGHRWRHHFVKFFQKWSTRNACFSVSVILCFGALSAVSGFWRVIWV